MHKAIIFDLDGVIVLTNHLKAKAHSSAVKYFGGHADEKLYQLYLGFPHSLVREKFMQEGSLKTNPETYTEKYREIYNSLLSDNIEIAQGVHKLIKQLKRENYLLAIVSSNTRAIVSKILNAINFSSYFDFFISSDDIKRDKPEPDGYLAAIKKLNVQINHIAVFEDSSAGISAAKMAGLKIVAVRHSLNKQQDFSNADCMIESFIDTDKVIGIINMLIN